MSIIHFIKIALLVAAVISFFQTKAGQKVGKFLPTPFWIYFVSILCGTVGLLPQKSTSYDVIGLHFLPAALVLMLIGSPIYLMVRIGPRAFGAMLLASITMFIGAIVSFVIFGAHMPDDGWKMAGTMLGTWTGGSANMLAVKEVVGLSDDSYGPLVISDTFLSYGWLALLMAGVAIQKWFDRGAKMNIPDVGPEFKTNNNTVNMGTKAYRLIVVLLVGFAVGEAMIILGGLLSPHISFLSKKAWAILLSCTVAVALATTRLNNLEKWKAGSIGTFILYMVLATMGAKTNLSAAVEAPVVIMFAAGMILIHGVLLFSLGRFLKFPLFLLTTASQANVGGPVSAPIVAGVYRPQAAQVGVLMAIFGAIFGTYIGSLGAGICKLIAG